MHVGDLCVSVIPHVVVIHVSVTTLDALMTDEIQRRCHFLVTYVLRSCNGYEWQVLSQRDAAPLTERWVLSLFALQGWRDVRSGVD